MKYYTPLIFLNFISLFSPILTGLCGLNPPEDKSYCGNYLALNKTHRCSYCKEIATGKYYCLIQTNFPKSNNSIEGYECESNDDILVNEDLPGSPCLNHKEIKNTPEENITEEFCHEHSVDEKHPCCYYDDGLIKKCFSIGKITSKTLYTYSDFLKCFAMRIKCNIFMELILLFIFIVF